MATVLTTAAVERAILDAIATYNVRAGQVAPLGGVQMKLYPGVQADELKAALQSMIDKGWIEISGTFIKLTDAGFAEM